jgi:DNA mismatch repair protein MutL
MAKIRRLSSDLANQIAAGEVVERPASVVKELVENALDAGATKVKVELDSGGLAKIRVSDDGDGMDPDDARLALERHATSKIRAIHDLAQIATFGFRGEALPSIASVSKLKLVTRTRGASEGSEIAVEAGGKVRAKPAGCAEGTIVEVCDLFYNVPARKKFMKTQATEAAHVGEVVMLAALSRPDVTFVLARDGRVAREYLRVATRRERVEQALTEERLEPVVATRGPLKLEAHLGPPERARAGAVALYIFVNGRPVKDRQLTRAVAQAYGSVLEPGRYPVGAVYIELPPDTIDVNVHPQKAEVRFADARALFEAVMRELHAGLADAFSIPAISSRGWHTPPRRHLTQPVAPGSDDDDTLRSIPKAAAVPMPYEKPPTIPPPSTLQQQILTAPAEPPKEHGSNPQILSAKPYSADPTTMKSLEENEIDLFASGGFYARLRYLAQVRATFLVCEGDDGLYVLDQHAAAERVTFDRLRRAYAARGVSTQQLLIPEVVELTAREVEDVESAGEEIAALGLELRAVGANAVAVHAVPRLLVRARPDRLVRDLLAEIGRAAKRPFGDAADLVLATMACHGSVRAGDAMAPEEVTALLRALDDVDFAGHYPHGRPVVTRISFEDLERRVGR